MSKADLHLHSIYSEHPSDWFLQRLGAGESYTQPEYIYKRLKQQGMDFVTITDHNKIDGALLLKEKYPEDVFVSVESTAYFPEDNCKVHILIYDITQEQFDIIEEKRTNIYELRDYLKEANIIHSVAHATYSVNGILKLYHLERLILLFDVFEGINGGRNAINNTSWVKVLENLSQKKVCELVERHQIKPYSKTPWIKGITGGSDDHAGIFLGKTYTTSNSEDMKGFLESIRNKKTGIKGRHNDYKSLAFMVYKIAIEFSKTKSSVIRNSHFGELTDLIYEGKPLNLKNRMKYRRAEFFSSLSKSTNDAYVNQVFTELINGLHKYHRNSDYEVRLDYTFRKLSQIVDAYFDMLFAGIEKNVQKGNLLKIVRNISSSIPGIFLTLPFFSTLKVMFSSRKLINEMEIEFETADYHHQGEILWFTDTLTDLNGVSASLQKVIELSGSNDLPIKVISCIGVDHPLEKSAKYVELPKIHSFCLPYYDNQMMVMPSPLRALDLINRLEPGKIIISTPGPVGMLGLLAARLFNIPAIGVYHTDFKAQLANILKDESLPETIGKMVKWFYSQMDEIFAPSRYYMEILSERGIDKSRIKLLPRGVDFSIFDYNPEAREQIQTELALPDGYYLIYTGRMSEDKQIEILLRTFKELRKAKDDIFLVMAGEGPQREEYQRKYEDSNLIFTGKLDRNILGNYLSSCDLFVFPSIADTFGMSVLEAQACCLPALVTNQGGPQEIIEDGVTGYVLTQLKVETWYNKILEMYNFKRSDPDKYWELRKNCRIRAQLTSGWDNFFNAFLSN